MRLDELLKENGVQIKAPGEHHHARPGWFQMDCPFCGRNNKRYHMGLAMSSWHFSCYRCGKLDRTQTVAELLQISIGQAIQALKQLDGFGRSSLPAVQGRIQGKLKLPYGIEPLGPRHRAYLEGRGFDPDELVRTYGIGGIGFAPPNSHRIFIPITMDGKVVSYTMRSILKKVGLRYISAPAKDEDYPHKHLLYGEDKVEAQAIGICEGPISKWAVGVNAVATCGLGFTRPQLIRMSKYPLRVTLFDSEPGAQRRALQLCDSLAAFPGRTVNIELDAEDPAEALLSNPKELVRVRRMLSS